MHNVKKTLTFYSQRLLCELSILFHFLCCFIIDIVLSNISQQRSVCFSSSRVTCSISAASEYPNVTAS
jgi:hypothetical protein